MTEPTPGDLFVGVDGGATKTRITVLDSSGAVAGEAIGPASTLALSAEAAWRVIETVFAEARRALPGTSARLTWGIGVAGTELSAEYARFRALVEETATARVVSDAHTACVGAHGGRDGAIVAVGTGLVGYRIAGGAPRRAAGWGFPQDDRGSGAWIGLDAIGAALRALDGRARASALTDELIAGFDGRAECIVAWAGRAGAADFAALAPRVAAHARAGDRSASNILARAGREIADVFHAVLVDCPPDLPVALVGGLAETLAVFLPEPLAARLTAPDYDASRGAALMALDHAGFTLPGHGAR